MLALILLAVVLSLGISNTAAEICEGRVHVGRNRYDPTGKNVTVPFYTKFCQKPTIEVTVEGARIHGDTFRSDVLSIGFCQFRAFVYRPDPQVKTWWQRAVWLNWTIRFEKYKQAPTNSSGLCKNNTDDCSSCPTGVQGCEDARLCEAKHRKCPPESLWNGTMCVCTAGYVMQGNECTDLDECETGQHKCHSNAMCSNHKGSYSCSCDFGYAGNGFQCDDVDECNLPHRFCHANAVCTNHVGSFQCRCPNGFSGSGPSCADIDECDGGNSSSACHINARCTNTVGSFQCQCKDGFIGNGTHCQDKNECQTSSHRCHANASCLNSVGSYSCTCDDGFAGNGTNCEDIDECAASLHLCHPHSTCKNVLGSYRCECKTGYRSNGSECEDINECEESTRVKCHRQAKCVNFHGGHECQCGVGFNGNGTHCVDTNECLYVKNNCSSKSMCFNSYGSFLCICLEGFKGDGLSCQDRDECSENTDNCHSNAVCHNTIGSFKCTCKDGYNGDGQTCEDHDECSTESHGCHVNATCTNLAGNYTCQCDDGFTGDGQSCAEFCETQQIDGFSFNSSLVDLSQESNERCPDGTPEVTALCVPGLGRAEFRVDEFRGCNISLDATLARLTGNTESVARASKFLAKFTSNGSNLDEETVGNVVDFLQSVSVLAQNNSIEVSAGTLDNILDAVGHLNTEYLNNTDNAKSQQCGGEVVKAVSSLAYSVQLNDTKPTFGYNSSSFFLEVTQNNGTDYPRVNFTALGSLAVVVPPKAIKSAWQSPSNGTGRQRRSAFIYYKGDSLFKSQDHVQSVVSVDLGDSTHLQNLTDPVKIEFRNEQGVYTKTTLKRDKLKALKKTAQCVYWDFNTSSWSTEGCCLNYTSDPPECLCYHLTNFALIVKSELVPVDAVLNVVSTIGCIASILCLFLTIVSHMMAREMRRRRPVKILVSICFNLMIADLVFVTGVARTHNRSACTLVAVLLHYFFLSTWCWMTVYSYDMYMSVVKVFRRDHSKFLQRVSTFAYATPLVIVIFTVAIAIGHFDQVPEPKSGLCNGEPDPFESSSSYRSETVCWLKGYSLYLGFLLPVGILLTFNVVSFAFIFREIACKKSEGYTPNLRRTHKQRFVIAITMSSVMGITWVFGYVMLISDDEAYLRVMSWLFAIFNSSQGISIFVLTSLRSQELRRVWSDPLSKCLGRKPRKVSRTGQTSVIASSAFTTLPVKESKPDTNELPRRSTDKSVQSKRFIAGSVTVRPSFSDS